MLNDEELLILQNVIEEIRAINETLQFLGLAILSVGAEPKNIKQSYTQAYMDWLREKEKYRNHG